MGEGKGGIGVRGGAEGGVALTQKMLATQAGLSLQNWLGASRREVPTPRATVQPGLLKKLMQLVVSLAVAVVTATTASTSAHIRMTRRETLNQRSHQSHVGHKRLRSSVACMRAMTHNLRMQFSEGSEQYYDHGSGWLGVCVCGVCHALRGVGGWELASQRPAARAGAVAGQHGAHRRL